MFSKNTKNNKSIPEETKKNDKNKQDGKLIIDRLIISFKRRRGKQKIVVPESLQKESSSKDFEKFIKQKLHAMHLIKTELYGEKNCLKLFEMLSSEDKKNFILSIKKILCEKKRICPSDLSEEEKKLWKKYSFNIWVAANSNDACPDISLLSEKIRPLLRRYYDNLKQDVTAESAKYFKIKHSMRGNYPIKNLPVISDLTPEHQAELKAIFQKKQKINENPPQNIIARKQANKVRSKIHYIKSKQIRNELNKKPVELLTEEEHQIKKKYNEAYQKLQQLKHNYAVRVRAEYMQIINEAESCEDLSAWSSERIRQLKYAQLFKLKEIFNSYLKTKIFLEDPEAAPLPERIKGFLPEVKELAEIYFNAKRNNFLGRHDVKIENIEECALNVNGKLEALQDVEKPNTKFLYDLTSLEDIRMLRDYIKKRDGLGEDFKLIFPDVEINDGLCIMDSGEPLQLGICALESFEKGQFIADYEGEQYGPFPNKKLLEEKINSLENTDYLLEFKKDKNYFLVDARQKRSLAAFANSKENANASICMVNNKVCIIATNQIEPGEQIFIRYDFPHHKNESELNKMGTSLFALIAKVVSVKLNQTIEAEEIKATLLSDTGRSVSLRNQNHEKLFISISVIEEWLSTLQPEKVTQEKRSISKIDISLSDHSMSTNDILPTEKKQDELSLSTSPATIFFKDQNNKRKNTELEVPVQKSFYPRYPGGRRFAPKKIYLPLPDSLVDKPEKKYRK